jgi:hypothetical protein
MDTWLRVANTTIAEYIRQEEVNILRSRKLLALLQSKGRITFGHSGTLMDWKVRYKRAPITGYADGDTLSFPRQERHKTAQLDWRGYSATDSFTKFERLQNRSTEAIVKVVSELATFLKDDIQDNFGEELYVDGNATGNTKRIHGLESFLSTSGAVSAAVPVELNNDTYAGLSTAPGNYGGSWTTSSGNSTWPLGSGDPHYDFWTPLVTNAANSNFNAATDNWRNNAVECLRFALVHTRSKNKSARGNVELVLFDNELYRVFLEVNDSRQQIRISRGEKVGMVALGFEDVINFDGVDVTSEYGIPVNVGYGIAPDAMELCSMQDQLFVPDSDTEISTKANRFSIDFFGNLKCNPRNFFKIKTS